MFKSGEPEATIEEVLKIYHPFQIIYRVYPSSHLKRLKQSLLRADLLRNRNNNQGSNTGHSRIPPRWHL